MITVEIVAIARTIGMECKNMSPQTNFSLVERVQGHGPAIEREELLDLMVELDAWRGAGCEE